MPGQNGEGAIELLGKHDASQFVRKCEGRKRERLRGAAADGFRKTLRATAEKRDFARAAIAHPAHPLGELRRRPVFSGVVQQHDGGRGIER